MDWVESFACQTETGRGNFVGLEVREDLEVDFVGESEEGWRVVGV